MSSDDRSVHAYRSFVNPHRLEILEALGTPLETTSAAGSWIEDASGRRYLDFLCGFGAATLGHRAPEVIDALRGVFASSEPLTSPLGVPPRSGQLAAKLCTLAGHGLSKVFFCNSGSEGIEAALKFSMARTSRKNFLAFDRAFHGMTLGALSLCGAANLRDPFAALGLDVERARFGDLDDLERLLERLQPAAVVVEPIQGMAGGRRWSGQDLSTMAQLCHSHGTLLIFDEVLTGCGRTGRWFAFQEAGPGIRPDIVVISKGITGGAIPVGAVLMAEGVYDAVFGGRAGIHASTFEAHLPGMAVGLAVLEAIECGDLLNNVTEQGTLIEKTLLEMKEKGLPIRQVRASGLLISIEIDDALRDGDLWGAVLCRQRLLEQGAIVNLAAQNLSCLNLTPPFTVSTAEVEFFCQRLEEALTL